jgi:FkbM family methyltransferase
MIPEAIKAPLRRAFLWSRKFSGKNPEIFSPHGIPIRIPADADVFLRFRLSRGIPHEAPEARMVQRHIRPHENVLELGGSVGIVSAVIRKTIGPDAQHVILEANPDLIEICKENANIGAKPGRTEVVAEVLDSSGSASVCFRNTTDALGGRVARHGEDGVEVRATTLAKLVKRIRPGWFALVCDIEGAELALLERELQAMARVRVFILECHPHLYPGKQVDLDRIIGMTEGCGFQLVDSEHCVYTFVRPGI